MSFLRYPEYRESSAHGIERIPSEWKILPIKRIGYLKGGAGFPHEKQGVLGEELYFFKVNCLARADLSGFVSESENTISREIAQDLGALVFPAETIMFAKVGAALLLGRLRMLKDQGCLDNNLMGLIVFDQRFNPRFIYYAMNLVRFDYIVNPGAVPSLNENNIGECLLPVPSFIEQKNIANFLDQETAKIDALIAEQEKLIALLKEKRQAVISHAVTKGLDPSVKMKDSGVEWLGQVPEHWEVTPIKHLGKIVSGFAFNSHHFVPSGVRVLKISNIQTFKKDWADESYVPEEFFDKHKGFSVENGDVVFALTRPIISSGLKAAVISIGDDERILLNQRNALFRPLDVVEKGFVYQVLFSHPFMAAFENEIDFTGQQPNVSPIDIGNIKIPTPPLVEQKAIAVYLGDIAREFELLAANAKKLIEILNERRSALISAAVTGQIDVRSFVPEAEPA